MSEDALLLPPPRQDRFQQHVPGGKLHFCWLQDEAVPLWQLREASHLRSSVKEPQRSAIEWPSEPKSRPWLWGYSNLPEASDMWELISYHNYHPPKITHLRIH